MFSCPWNVEWPHGQLVKPRSSRFLFMIRSAFAASRARWSPGRVPAHPGLLACCWVRSVEQEARIAHRASTHATGPGKPEVLAASNYENDQRNDCQHDEDGDENAHQKPPFEMLMSETVTSPFEVLSPRLLALPEDVSWYYPRPCANNRDGGGPGTTPTWAQW